MRIALIVLAGVVLLAGLAMLWQHLRYLNARRQVVQDHQPVFYSSRAFHTVTYLQVADGADPIDAVRALREETSALPDVQWIYAGKVAVNALQSSQLGENHWSAIAILQHPSREDWDRVAQGDVWPKALSRFQKTYTHGFKRSPWLNLALPQALLAMRTALMLRGGPEGYPFEPAPEAEREVPRDARIEDLARESELGRDAVVIMNLIQNGDAEQRAADGAYARRMLQMMAWLGYGPMHMANAVTVEGDARFDRMALVYYPGVEYFTEMAQSRYFQGIIGGKQLADTTAVMTVPILDRL